MATKVEVQTRSAKADSPVVEFEVSGGAYGDLSNDSRTFEVGESNSMIQFLTLKRVGQGDVTIKSLGKVTLDVDGKRNSKKLKSGNTFKFSGKTKDVVVRESIK